ncbi:MAG: type I DNA topoisomerase [Planctomycetota bacterium]|jgi:DNA topoisomerase-1
MTARSSSSSRKSTRKALVIAESPAKARTIERVLGKGFTVKASIGHVRDLPSSSADLPPSLKKSKHARLGVDLENDFEPIYVVPPEKKDQIRTLKRLMKDAGELWLATDEDREGEAISWHLCEVLKPKVPTHRLVFHEITKEAIAQALESPRDIDENLVEAQETRRILDRLFGYEVSPVLWRKIRTGLSAGRVQSVTLRLLVDRERERMAFRAAEYWDLSATFSPTERKSPFAAVLRRINGQRVAEGRDFEDATGKVKTKDVTVLDAKAAHALVERLKAGPATVLEVEEKPYTQKPAPPFTTSTMQQEAGRKLRFSARRAMRVAQTLYENGVITYMRTDSTALSHEALNASRSFIRENYAPAYLPDAPRTYKTKVKNAQEAHEAIRPAGAAFQSVDDVRRAHGDEAAALYELIWMRTVASQMPDARGRRVTVRVGIEESVFRASGKTIEFPGFQRAYVEGSDDPEAQLAERESLLPPMEVGQTLDVVDLEAQQHTTQPPARFTEASLVKELDKRGIGRPSTWASMIALLLDRNYAFRKGTALVPTFTGFAVVRMLKDHFEDLLDYEFTARMEDDLDAVSRGEGHGRDYLRRFYAGNGRMGLQQLVKTGLDRVDPREACRFVLGEVEGKTIELRVGKYGLFLTDGEANASLPENTVPDEMTLDGALEALAKAAEGPKPLGEDPESGKPVYLKTGPYGPYVQLGEQENGNGRSRAKAKPKMVSLLRGMAMADVDLALALRLLSLPRDLGPHPEDPEGGHVHALTGRYGPYVRWGKESRSIPEETSVLDITLEQAVALLKQPRRRGGSTATVLHDLGPHPETGTALRVMKGRYGPYVTDGEINASLPRDTDPAALTLDEAVELLRKRAERLKAQGGPRRKGRKKKKKTAGKKATKKKAVKKAAKRKTAKKKAG